MLSEGRVWAAGAEARWVPSERLVVRDWSRGPVGAFGAVAPGPQPRSRWVPSARLLLPESWGPVVPSARLLLNGGSHARCDLPAPSPPQGPESSHMSSERTLSRDTARSTPVAAGNGGTQACEFGVIYLTQGRAVC